MELDAKYFTQIESQDLLLVNGGGLTEAAIWAYALAGSYSELYFLCVVFLGINPVGLTIGAMASILVAALF